MTSSRLPPFHSQLEIRDDSTAPDVVATLDWASRTCAIACLTMVLDHFGRCDSMSPVLRAALDRGALDEGRGWRHGELVAVLQDFGLAAFRRNWRLLDGREAEYLAGRPRSDGVQLELDLVRRQMIGEGVGTLRAMLAADAAVIVSVLRPFGNIRSIGHQVVLLGIDSNEVTYHDPAEYGGAFRRCSVAEFIDNWKGTSIVAVEPASVADVISPNRG
jgi:hypothetical protein